jgi:hypothetical protein
VYQVNSLLGFSTIENLHRFNKDERFTNLNENEREVEATGSRWFTPMDGGRRKVMTDKFKGRETWLAFLTSLPYLLSETPLIRLQFKLSLTRVLRRRCLLEPPQHRRSDTFHRVTVGTVITSVRASPNFEVALLDFRVPQTKTAFFLLGI